MTLTIPWCLMEPRRTRERRISSPALKAIGYSCCLLSNNQRPRVEMFNREIQVNFIENAHKPSRKNYRKAMELMKTREKNTLFVGDQHFTDVYGAKRTGIYSILVKPFIPRRKYRVC